MVLFVLHGIGYNREGSNMNKKNSLLRFKKLKNKMIELGANNICVGEHAEMWWFDKGNNIPNRDTFEWAEMYHAWCLFAWK